MNTILFEHPLPTGQTLRVVQGDLTAEPVGAIVNAANEHLQHGGGVAGAIRRTGGPTIQQESNAWVQQHGPVKTGTAAITGAACRPPTSSTPWGRCGAAATMRRNYVGLCKAPWCWPISIR